MGELSLFPGNGDQLSIQGEQQRFVEETLWASDDELRTRLHA